MLANLANTELVNEFRRYLDLRPKLRGPQNLPNWLSNSHLVQVGSFLGSVSVAGRDCEWALEEVVWCGDVRSASSGLLVLVLLSSLVFLLLRLCGGVSVRLLWLPWQKVELGSGVAAALLALIASGLSVWLAIPNHSTAAAGAVFGLLTVGASLASAVYAVIQMRRMK